MRAAFVVLAVACLVLGPAGGSSARERQDKPPQLTTTEKKNLSKASAAWGGIAAAWGGAAAGLAAFPEPAGTKGAAIAAGLVSAAAGVASAYFAYAAADPPDREDFSERVQIDRPRLERERMDLDPSEGPAPYPWLCPQENPDLCRPRVARAEERLAAVVQNEMNIAVATRAFVDALEKAQGAALENARRWVIRQKRVARAMAVKLRAHLRTELSARRGAARAFGNLSFPRRPAANEILELAPQPRSRSTHPAVLLRDRRSLDSLRTTIDLLGGFLRRTAPLAR